MTALERVERMKRIEAAKTASALKRIEESRAGIASATRHWNRALPFIGEHPYLTKKGVRAYGIRRQGAKLLVPVRGADGKIMSVQFIDRNGQKRFLTDAPVAGGYHAIGVIDARIIIAEGYATAATAHAATGDAVAVAFDCGNLMAVAIALRSNYPAHEIVFAADDDWRSKAQDIGRIKAEEAAEKVGGRVVMPLWSSDRGINDTDFNDMARLYGLEVVAEVLV